MESKELTIVIVTFKSDEKISNCLKSISREIPVLVIENSNNINFKKNIENNFHNVKCILTGENKGYSFANNVGLRLVKTKYALVLNPDTILDKNIIINHEGGSSVNKFFSFELEKNRNWHWMWSTFYYHKKYKGFLLATIITFPKLLSAIFKSLFYLIIFNKTKRDIYFCRLSGILNSMADKKSWYRPALD